MKIKDIIYDIITPTVSLDYVTENAGAWNGGYAERDKYVYYDIKDKTVKVKAIEVLRQALSEKESDIYKYRRDLSLAEEDIDKLTTEIDWLNTTLNNLNEEKEQILNSYKHLLTLVKEGV